MLHHSYKIMLRCWDKEAKKRGTFDLLKRELNAMLESDGNYISVFPSSHYYQLLPNTKYKLVSNQCWKQVSSDNAHDNETYDNDDCIVNDCGLTQYSDTLIRNV